MSKKKKTTSAKDIADEAVKNETTLEENEVENSVDPEPSIPESIQPPEPPTPTPQAPPEPAPPAPVKVKTEVIEKLPTAADQYEMNQLAILEKEMVNYKKAMDEIIKTFELKLTSIPTNRKTIFKAWAVALGNLVSILIKTKNTKIHDDFLKFINANMSPGKCFHSENAFSYISVIHPSKQVDIISTTITAFTTLAEFYEKQKVDKSATLNIDVKRLVGVTKSETLGSYITRN